MAKYRNYFYGNYPIKNYKMTHKYIFYIFFMKKGKTKLI